MKQARQQHQTVEEKKNPAYLNIGRHLASQGIAPPSAPHFLADVQRRRAAVDRHAEHKQELAVLSSQIDKQELRKFYFTIFSLLALLAIILPLVSQSPIKRDWLPQDDRWPSFRSISSSSTRVRLINRWRKEQPELWRKVATGLLGPAARHPGAESREASPPRDARADHRRRRPATGVRAGRNARRSRAGRPHDHARRSDSPRAR